MKKLANWKRCSDTDENHSLIDGVCYGCYPFWDLHAVCPVHGNNLKTTGYCRNCKKYYDLSNEPK